MTVKYVLRDLPGVAELEAMLDRIQAHPSPCWAPENDNVVPLATKLIRDLFGINVDDPLAAFQQADNYLPGMDVWARSFVFTVEGDEEEFYDEQAEADKWLEYGWDVRRTDGEPMRALSFFDAAIVAALQGYNGARLPGAPPSDAEISARAADFEARLKADLEKFRKGR